jgi:hypothetical protein
MKRTAWGMMVMGLSFLLGMIIAVGSLISMGGQLNTARLTGTPLSAPTVLVTCLDPFVILLEIAAIALIVIDSKAVGNSHRRLAWISAVAFVIWGALNLGVFLPVSFIGMQRGSLALVKAGMTVKAVAGLLQYAIPFLLVFELSRGVPRSRLLLWAALILTVVGNFGVVIRPLGGLMLDAVETAGRTVYAPRFDVDYRHGWYPLLLGMGYAGGLLYMVAYGLLGVRFFKVENPEVSGVPLLALQGEDRSRKRSTWVREAGDE